MSGMEDLPKNEVVENTGESEGRVEKPDFVKKIESFDMDNLTPENVEFMTNVIQAYFSENFPANPELIDELSGRITVVPTEGFKEALYRNASDDEVSITGLDDTNAFFCVPENKIYINKDECETPGMLFFMMFHESLHYVSKGNGAGLDGTVVLPEEVIDDPDALMSVRLGICGAMEGTTQVLALNSVKEMGFDSHDDMFGYYAETHMMKTIWDAFSPETRNRVYFEDSLRDVTDYIGSTFSNDGHGGSVVAESLMIMHDVAEALKEVYSLDDVDEMNREEAEIDAQVKHSIGYFIVSDYQRRGVPIDERMAKDYADYVGPYINKGEE